MSFSWLPWFPCFHWVPWFTWSPGSSSSPDPLVPCPLVPLAGLRVLWFPWFPGSPGSMFPPVPLVPLVSWFPYGAKHFSEFIPVFHFFANLGGVSRHCGLDAFDHMFSNQKKCNQLMICIYHFWCRFRLPLFVFRVSKAIEMLAHLGPRLRC